MGLAAIDSHSQKEHIEIHKTPKIGVIGLVFTEIEKRKKFTKKCIEIRTLCYGIECLYLSEN